MPIYWLNGAKVADDYDDFYDGTWSNKNSGRGVAGDLISGTSSSARQLLCTGTADDGTTTNRPLGGGAPDSNRTSECTATSIAITTSTLSGNMLDVTGRPRYLTLSNVFRVGSTTVPMINDVSISSSPGSDREYTTGDEIRITVTFSEAVLVTGSPYLLFRIDALNDEGDLVQSNRRANYDAETSSSTALVFSYTVRSLDFDKDGIWVKADKLRLNGGAIQNAAGEVDADLSYDTVSIQARHKIHVPARVTDTSVISTPAVGTSYATGETITIEVTFDRNVAVLTENGTPSYAMNFGVAYDSLVHHAIYARVVDGDKVQFDYVVQADDYDPDGIVAMDPAIRWNQGPDHKGRRSCQHRHGRTGQHLQHIPASPGWTRRECLIAGRRTSTIMGGAAWMRAASAEYNRLPRRALPLAAQGLTMVLLAVLATLFAADTHAQAISPATGRPIITPTAQVGETLRAGTDDI